MLVLLSCASSSTPDSPITARIIDINPTSDIRFAGPVAIRFRVEITNPTNESVALRKVEIHTSASTAFAVRVTANYDRTVAPGQAIEVELHATGTAAGGRLAHDEPLTFRATAYFDSPKGPFVKMFSETARLGW